MIQLSRNQRTDIGRLSGMVFSGSITTCVDVFKQHLFTAGGMLQVDGVVVASIQAGVGRDRDAEFMQFARQLIAYIQGQVFAAMGAIDR
jgi:hypothetical protein